MCPRWRGVDEGEWFTRLRECDSSADDDRYHGLDVGLVQTAGVIVLPGDIGRRGGGGGVRSERAGHRRHRGLPDGIVGETGVMIPRPSVGTRRESSTGWSGRRPASRCGPRVSRLRCGRYNGSRVLQPPPRGVRPAVGSVGLVDVDVCLGGLTVSRLPRPIVQTVHLDADEAGTGPRRTSRARRGPSPAPGRQNDVVVPLPPEPSLECLADPELAGAGLAGLRTAAAQPSMNSANSANSSNSSRSYGRNAGQPDSAPPMTAIWTLRVSSPVYGMGIPCGGVRRTDRPTGC